MPADDDQNENDQKKGSIKGEWDPGTGAPPDTLFTPEELDIYVNKVTKDAYIFHAKPVEKNIERLEYNPEDHSVTVVKQDGARLDLGVKIQWLIRPYFTKAQEVFIVRTKDGETIDGFVVPLVNLGEKSAENQ